MSDSPPPGAAADAAGSGVPALTPGAIATAVEDFRRWLTAAAANGDAPAGPPERGADLSTLVGQFTALRHEVNLQTRAVRAQQEQNAETLGRLTEALDALAQTPARRAAPCVAGEDAVRPLLKTLVDLYDAAALAGRELRRVRESASAALAPTEDGRTEQPPRAPAWWARWFGSRAEDATRRERLRATNEAAEAVRRTLEATAAGFAMTLQRVERAMAEHGLEPIPAVGATFDPERMEALEVVLDSGRPSGEVVEEVRRGYLWQGRVFRYSQVRVAKSNPQTV